MGLGIAQRSDVLSRLREEIRRIERRPDRRTGGIPCGLEGVDEALPAGGFPRGALSEVRGGPSSGKTAVALSLVARLPGEELAAFVDGTGELYPPAAEALGVDLRRLLLVRPPGGREGGKEGGALSALWAAEALLASGAFSAVLLDVPFPPRLRGGAEGALRRLQTAAERGGAIGLWLPNPGEAARVPAGVRLDVALSEGRIVARRSGRSPPVRVWGDGHAA